MTPEEIRMRQNLLNVLYQGHAIFKDILKHPEYALLQKAYAAEVVTNGSATALASDLSRRMREKRRALQDEIARSAVERIEALPENVIAKISELIDAGKRKQGSKYRYPAFDDLLTAARSTAA